MSWLIANTFRKFLLCLLVLAIPAQGYAAATMRFCSPVSRAALLQLADIQSHHAKAADSAAVDHSKMNHHGSNSKGDSQESTKSKCSVCAACCHAIAIITTLPTALYFPQLASSVAQPQLEAIIFLTGGLERPPRTFLL